MAGLLVVPHQDRVWKAPSHCVASITPNDKGIELRVILLEKLVNIEIKSGDIISQFLVADYSGSIKCNFYGESGTKLKAGDIIYLAGAYSALFKDTTLTLYSGRKSRMLKIGEFFMDFSETPNMSEMVWERDPENFSLFRRKDTS
jgi:hypothetical protein